MTPVLYLKVLLRFPSMVSTQLARLFQPVDDMAAQGMANRDLRMIEKRVRCHPNPKHNGL
jgi:hypothetical protein